MKWRTAMNMGGIGKYKLLRIVNPPPAVWGNAIEEILGSRVVDWVQDGVDCSYAWFMDREPYRSYMQRLELPDTPDPEKLMIHPEVFIADKNGNRIISIEKCKT